MKFTHTTIMQQYHELLQDILDNGEDRDDRTGVGTRAVFGRQLRFDLRTGFPAITTKRLAWNAVVSELLWFLEGSSDERRLAEITHGTRDGVTTIWTPNALAPYWVDRAAFEGDLGPVYGVQWRNWRGVDQIRELITGLKTDPTSRRHIVSAWNVDQLADMALPPCHLLHQYWVNNRRELSCMFTMRSTDMFLGASFNIASYALLTHMIAHVCDLKVGELVMNMGDAHIYHNHMDQVREQLTREHYPSPRLYLNYDVSDIDDFTKNDIILTDYQSHSAIRAPMAV